MQASNEVTVMGNSYKLGRMDAMTQFHCTRRLAAVLASMGESFKELQDRGGAKALLHEAVTDGDVKPDVYRLMKPVLAAIGAMSDDDAEFVVNSCLKVVERGVGGDRGWAKVMQADVLMYQDIQMPAMLALTFHVLRTNLASFFFEFLSGLVSPAEGTGPNLSAAGSTG